LSKDFDQKLANFLQEEASQKPTQASRTSSQVTLEFLTKELPELIGGSADLTGSVLTKTSSTNSISKDSFENRYIHYGIREHAMASVMNGIALHSNFIPYGGTFLVFSDYMKPAIRLSALMNQQIFYILTHDSIGLGEDGPTHQPIEHLAMLRAIPNLNLYRPADLEETIKSYESALKNSNSPSAFAFSRQNLPFIEKDQPCKTSGYIVKNSQNPQITLIATGSELHLAVEASKELQKENIENKIISIPSLDEFEKLSKSEKEILIGDKNSIKIAIEAAIEQGWRKIIGENGIFIGMNSFGASGKATDLFEHFKITSKEVIKKALEALEALKTKTNN
jgi:transketolase